MPINLGEYTPRKRKHLRAVKACCIYVIGEQESGPLKIGIAGDIVQRFKQLDERGFTKLAVHYVLWTPGRPVAQRVEGYVHSLMIKAGRTVKGEWFAVDTKSAKTTIEWASRQLYPNASLYSHEKIISQLEKKVMERPRKSTPVDTLHDIDDIRRIAEMFGSASSPARPYKNPVRDLAQVIEEESQYAKIADKI